MGFGSVQIHFDDVEELIIELIVVFGEVNLGLYRE